MAFFPFFEDNDRSQKARQDQLFVQGRDRPGGHPKGNASVYVAEMDHVIWRTCESHKRPAMVNPSSQNDAEIIGVKNQSIIAYRDWWSVMVNKCRLISVASRAARGDLQVEDGLHEGTGTRSINPCTQI